MEHLFYKFKNLSSTDFKTFKVFEDTKQTIKASNQKLDEIIRESSKSNYPSEDFIKTILLNFYDDEARDEFFAKATNAKKLSWVLDYKDQHFNESIAGGGYLTLALQLIEKKFNSSMYSGLLHALFSNWQNADFERLRNYISKKLKLETNQRIKVLYFQSILQYISTIDGPKIWAANFSLDQVIDPINFFNENLYIEYLRNTEYFHLFFIELYEQSVRRSQYREKQKWRRILQFSRDNFDSSISKYLIAFEIYHFENQLTENEELDELKNLGVSIIGDPIKSYLWVVENPLFSIDQKAIISRAQKILTKWINRTLINLFFSKVVDDYDRRTFWKEYIDSMSSVYIFLNSIIIWDIISDPRIKHGLENRIGVLKNGGPTTSVLIFDIQKYRFVLSGSTSGGALYVHPTGSNYFPKIDKITSYQYVSGKKLMEIDKRDLTHSHLPNLMSQPNNGFYSYRNKDEGRMVHSGRWMVYLKKWMAEKLPNNGNN